MRLPFVSLILASALTGCIATANGGFVTDVSVSTPDLVMVSPGVQVVADYDDSVFYSEGFYWRYDGGGWYRSNNYAGGFEYWAAPPQAIITINDPYRYRHYQPTGYQARHQPYRQPEPIVRDHRSPQPQPQPYRQPEPEVRDHRTPQPEPYRAPEPQGPVVRDHRSEQAPPPPPPAPAPVVRDHRNEAPPPPPPPATPVVRDHRH